MVKLKNVNIVSSNLANDSTGIDVQQGVLNMHSVKSVAGSTNGIAIGMDALLSFVEVKNSSFSAREIAIKITDSWLHMDDSAAQAAFRGLVNTTPAGAGSGGRIRNSLIQGGQTSPEASERGIDFFSNPDLTILNTQVIGGFTNDALGQQCFRSYDGTLAADLGC